MFRAHDSEVLQDESDIGLVDILPRDGTVFGTKIDESPSQHDKRSGEYPKKTQVICSNLTCGLILALMTTPPAALADPLSNVAFQKLAAQCAPGVSLATLVAVARIESGFNPWILHDNATHQTFAPRTLSDATTVLKKWVGHGDSVDIGLMQINSTNLGALRITTTMALDPCLSLAGGAAVLQAAYAGGDTPVEQQVALLMALSRYNTGSPFKGIMNGYARKVINEVGMTELSKPLPKEPEIPQVDPNEPPTWDVSATGKYAQIHGASWLVDLVGLTARDVAFVTSNSR